MDYDKPARFQIDTLCCEMENGSIGKIFDFSYVSDSMDKLLEINYKQYKLIWHLLKTPSKRKELIKVLEDLKIEKI